MKKIILSASIIVCLLFCVQGVCAQNMIRITDKPKQDELYLSDADLDPHNKEGFIIEFSGTVAAGTEKVVVLYFKNSVELIEEYTLSKFNPGDTDFVYRAGARLGNLNEGSNYYEFRAYRSDGRVFATRMTLYVHRQSMGEKAKPVIYLYPQKQTTVVVRVEPEDGLTKTIPEMGSGWTVTARPDGRITAADGHDYPYLFWESRDNVPIADINEGFCISAHELEGFFRDKLSLLGLNDKEIADFLEFWLPEMAGSPWYAIRFVPRSEQDREAPLFVTPTPDTIIPVSYTHLTLPTKRIV